LLARHQGWQQPVATILESAPELLRGPVYDVPTLPAWSKGRILLIGDAAHATSPHAGQGASLALEDAMALGKLLRNQEAHHEQVFAEFMRDRHGRVERVIAEARRRGDGKKRLTPSAAWVRDRVISALARVLGARMNKWMYSYKIAWER
jgi:2-polyprenyl-6-methoxyphenol hydroxylase-like FAD-dependent oxidoreductase